MQAIMRRAAVSAVILVGAFHSSVYAQVSTSDEPGREAVRFRQPVTALSKPGGTISLPGTVAPDGAASIVVRVEGIQIVGNSVYSDADLAPLLNEVLGADVSLAAIYQLAQKITAHYGDAGYVLSRAIIPPQELDPAGATITIQVVEGYVDRVEWPSATGRFRDFFSEYAANITAERPTNIQTVMRYLLLAGDLPGLDVTSRFQASVDNQNASTLIVELEEKPFDVFAQVDNRGTEPRGPWQFSTSASLNNVLGIHESLTFSYSGAMEIDELQRFAVGYKQVLTSDGMFGFVNGSWSWGEPGTPALEALEFNSNSASFDIGLGAPVIRERERNLTVSGLLFMSDNDGEMLGAPSSEDRLRGIRAMADFDFVDSLNGTTQGNFTLSHGFEGLGSTENGNPLASRENGRVDFTTLSASLSRLQEFDGGFSALFAATGQYAFTPLLSPEECGYGGREFGRAFDPAEVSGDSCFAVSAELRFSPELPDGPLSLAQAYAFADYGRVFRLEPSLGTESEQDGASAGAGLRFGTGNLSVDLSAAKPLTGRIEDGWRYFLTTTARY